MTAVDALWHVANLIVPTLVCGYCAALMAKAVWRRELRSTTLSRLCLSAILAAGLGYGIALAIAGRDGMIAAYAVMVLSTALSLWWCLLRARAA
jgi:hypothetical protein